MAGIERSQCGRCSRHNGNDVTLQPPETAQSEGFDWIPARLHSLWQESEVRPALKAGVRPSGHRRTRKDPLRASGATYRCGSRGTRTRLPRTRWRVGASHSERISDVQLQTLQRKVKAWRGIRAKRLVYTAADERDAERDSGAHQHWPHLESAAGISATFLGEATGTGAPQPCRYSREGPGGTGR